MSVTVFSRCLFFSLVTFNFVSSAQAQEAAPRTLTARDIIAQHGEPDEITVRALQNETEYRYGTRRFVIKDGVLSPSQSQQSLALHQGGGTKGRDRRIRAGQDAELPTSAAVTTIIADLQKEGSDPKAANSGNALNDVAPLMNTEPVLDSDF